MPGEVQGMKRIIPAASVLQMPGCPGSSPGGSRLRRSARQCRQPARRSASGHRRVGGGGSLSMSSEGQGRQGAMLARAGEQRKAPSPSRRTPRAWLLKEVSLPVYLGMQHECNANISVMGTGRREAPQGSPRTHALRCARTPSVRYNMIPYQRSSYRPVRPVSHSISFP